MNTYLYFQDIWILIYASKILGKAISYTETRTSCCRCNPQETGIVLLSFVLFHCWQWWIRSYKWKVRERRVWQRSRKLQIMLSFMPCEMELLSSHLFLCELKAVNGLFILKMLMGKKNWLFAMFLWGGFQFWISHPYGYQYQSKSY